MSKTVYSYTLADVHDKEFEHLQDAMPVGATICEANIAMASAHLREWFMWVFNDYNTAFNHEEGPLEYWGIVCTLQQIREWADIYRSDAIQRLWGLCHEEDEPCYDEIDLEEDYGVIMMLCQFAAILEDPDYLRPVYDSFNEISLSGYPHPYHRRVEFRDGPANPYNTPRKELIRVIQMFERKEPTDV